MVSLDKHGVPVSSPAQPVVLPYAVLRAAAWPIETVGAFAAPELATTADDIDAAERDAADRRASVLAELRAAIPRTTDVRLRRYLLAVKRHVHSTTLPFAPTPPDVQAPAVVAREAAERCALAEKRTAFEQLYASVLEQQRLALLRISRGHRFQRALLVANLPVAIAARKRAAPPRRPKRQRHLENTLFNYLMRACGRATPNGAWAGVAPVLPSSAAWNGLALVPARGRYILAPSLRPFVLMLRALAREARYRQARPLHLNPSLRPVATGGWRYEQDQAGVRRWVDLPWQPVVAAVIDAYADGARRVVGPLLDALAALWPEDADMRASLGNLADWLVDRDVLRTDLRLPSTAPDAWSALIAVTHELDEHDRRGWHEAIDRLHRLCETMADAFDDLTPEQLEGGLRSIEVEVLELWQAARLDGHPPLPLVHLDMRLPWSVTWNEASISQARRSVRALLTFHSADGGAELLRRQSVRDLFGALEGAPGYAAPVLDVIDALGWQVPPKPRLVAGQTDPPDAASDTLEFVLGQMAPNSALGQEARAYCVRWEQLLEPFHAQHRYVLPDLPANPDVLPGPGGAVLLHFAADGQIWFGAARPEASLYISRVASLLEPCVHVAHREIAMAAQHASLVPVEIVGWDSFNPNGALHPLLAQSSLDPHELQAVWIVGDPRRERLWLRKDGHLLAPIFCNGADLGYHDVCGRLLMVAATSHGWEYPSFQLPPPLAARTRWKHMPRLVLHGGDVLRPERWTIGRELLERLSAVHGAERYLAWRREVRRLQLPALMHARCGPRQPEVLFPTDSPLAVRCLFDTHAARGPWMELSELPGPPERWPIEDAEGNHYLAELAVTWAAEDYWQAVAPGPEVIDAT